MGRLCCDHYTPHPHSETQWGSVIPDSEAALFCCPAQLSSRLMLSKTNADTTQHRMFTTPSPPSLSVSHSPFLLPLTPPPPLLHPSPLSLSSLLSPSCPLTIFIPHSFPTKHPHPTHRPIQLVNSSLESQEIAWRWGNVSFLFDRFIFCFDAAQGETSYK